MASIVVYQGWELQEVCDTDKISTLFIERPKFKDLPASAANVSYCAKMHAKGARIFYKIHDNAEVSLQTQFQHF